MGLFGKSSLIQKDSRKLPYKRFKNSQLSQLYSFWHTIRLDNNSLMDFSGDQLFLNARTAEHSSVKNAPYWCNNIYTQIIVSNGTHTIQQQYERSLN